MNPLYTQKIARYTACNVFPFSLQILRYNFWSASMTNIYHSLVSWAGVLTSSFPWVDQAAESLLSSRAGHWYAGSSLQWCPGSSLSHTYTLAVKQRERKCKKKQWVVKVRRGLAKLKTALMVTLKIHFTHSIHPWCIMSIFTMSSNAPIVLYNHSYKHKPPTTHYKCVHNVLYNVLYMFLMHYNAL